MADSTLERVVMPLAMLEGPCRPHAYPGDLVGDPDRCPKCHGTGQKAEFPMLREPCTCKDGKFEVFSAAGREYVGLRTRLKLQGVKAPFWYDHPVCQGRGYLPVTTTDALLEAVWSAGYHVSYWNPEYIAIQQLMSDDRPIIGKGHGVVALALALCAAKGIEVKNSIINSRH